MIGDASLERQTLLVVWRRIVPALALALVCNYLDKVNIGFAALQMNAALGFSNQVFGVGAGVFALGYALFAIPSVLALERFGARRWLAIIMLAWGLASAATAFVATPFQLIVARFLLGAAEAGFTPAAILLLTRWFPRAWRGRVLGSFLFVQPLGLVLGGPLASLFLSLDGRFGLAGWQWLFIGEAVPTLLLALPVFLLLDDDPGRAGWLTEAQKAWLKGRNELDATGRGAAPTPSLAGTLVNGRLWWLALVNLAMSTAAIGTLIFLPLVIRTMGYSTIGTGLVAALPGLAGAAALPFWGWWADRAARREQVAAWGCLLLGLGLGGSALLLPSAAALAPICLAMIGFNGFMAAFWALPATFLTGAAVAVGIAVINIAGNLGTFTGPALVGTLSDATGGFAAGLVALAALAFAAAAASFLGRAPTAGAAA